MHITYIYSDTKSEWNSSEWRCAVPAKAINQTGEHQASLVSIHDFVRNTRIAKSVCDASDVLVVERSFFGPVIPIIREWQKKGKAVIGDFDDGYNFMPKNNAAYKYWGQGKLLKKGVNGKTRWARINPHPLVQFKEGLGILDAVTVSSEMLLNDWQEYNPSFHYIPNFILLDRYKHAKPSSHEGIVIGWGGSSTHLDSFRHSMIFPALQKICRDYPHVRIMICCNDTKLLEKIPVPSRQLIHQPYVPVDKWPDVLSRFDIGLAPMSGAYDDRRSWIKVLEYLVMSIPWAASEAPPYAMLKDYGLQANNTTEGWVSALQELIENIDKYRKNAALDPYQFGISKDINKNVGFIIDTYQKYTR